MGLSPDEGYVVWFDFDSRCYYSYERSTGTTEEYKSAHSLNNV